MNADTVAEGAIGIPPGVPGMAYRCEYLRDTAPGACRVRHLSDGCLGLTGYSAAELSRDGPFRYRGLIVPEHRERVARAVSTAVEANRPIDLEYTIVARDGRHVRVWERGVVVASRDRLPVLLEGFVIDVTRRSRAMEELRRYETIVSASRDLLALVDGDYRVLVVNDAFAAQFGIPKDAMVGMGLEFLYGMTVFRGVLKARLDVCLSGERVQAASWVRYPDGARRFIEVSYQPFLDGEDQVQGVVVSARDATRRRESEQALKRSEEQVRLLLESTAEAIYGLDIEGRCMFVNPACVRMLGYDRADELLGRQMHSVIHHTRPDGTPYPISECRIYRSYRLGERVRADDELLWRRDGTGFPAEYWSYPIRRDGEILGSVVTFQDISERRQAMAELKGSEARFRTLAELSPVGIFRTDARGACVYVNAHAAALVGVDIAECLGDGWLRHLHPDDRAHLLGRCEGSRQSSESFRLECRFRHPSGRLVWVIGQVRPLLDEQGQVTERLGTLTDVTELKQAQEPLRRLAHHDPLTGLPNRLLFMDRLDHALVRARRAGSMLAVLFLDLDDFKQINDTLGHRAGDRVLREVARRLQQRVRAGDTVARLGGDEFTILLERVNAVPDLHPIAGKLLADLAHPYALEDRELHLSASIGVSLFPRDGDTADTLIHRADAAMYQAKETGKNAFHLYSPDLDVSERERASLILDLRAALKNGGLLLYYQPQVDLAKGRIVGAEALVRWRHPDQGLIPAGRLIPLAEEAGLMDALGEWVLAVACRQAQAWREQGLPFARMAVNLSEAQFTRVGLADLVRDTTRAAGFPPSRLELELTEDTVMRQGGSVEPVLKSLKRLGVSLAIDDFGAGYSSLARLRRLPVDRLKIDRSIVREIPGNPDDMTVARAVIALGRSMGLRVVSEGVETEAQSDFLKLQRCHEAQGYLFSEPLPAARMEALMRSAGPAPRRTRTH